MTKEATSKSGNEHTVALTGSGEFRRGAQVIITTGLPEGYVPPSGSLTPPSEPLPPPPSGENDQTDK